MPSIKDAFKKLFKSRQNVNTPEDYRRKVVERADVIIDFAAGPQWPKFEEYINIKMASALEEAFNLVDKADDGALRAKIGEARAYYSFLKDLDHGVYTIKQEVERIKRPINT